MQPAPKRNKRKRSAVVDFFTRKPPHISSHNTPSSSAVAPTGSGGSTTQTPLRASLSTPRITPIIVSSPGRTFSPDERHATSPYPNYSGDEAPFTENTRTEETSPSEYAQSVWSAFKAILPIVEKVSVIFPPLQSAIGGIIGIISTFETCSSNVEKVQELTQTLDQLQRIISAYPGAPDSKSVSRLQFIQKVFEEARDAVERSRLLRLVHAPDDQSMLIQSMAKVTRFVNLLQLEISGQTEIVVKEMHQDVKYKDHADLLKVLEHIPNASFESTDSEFQSRVECTPGTRTQILEMLTQWALDPGGTPFFWLNGMAGTGKSTIAQSICNRLHADGILAASFFCSRSAGGGRNDARRIVPTLVFQLAHHIQGFMSEVCDVLRTPDMIKQSIATQLLQLLWAPLDNAFVTSGVSRRNETPSIIVIDGLDECSDVGAQDLVESLLHRFERDLPVHVRFLLLSRCERHIGIPFRKTSVDVSRFELHDLPHSQVTKDIRRYVEAGFSEMSERRNWGREWYTLDDIHFVVAQAGVLFIYAATVLKYIAQSKFRPERRLQILRQMAIPNKTKDSGVLRSLHLLYNVILENLGDADDLEDFEVELVRNILFLLSWSPAPLPIPLISDLLNSSSIEVRACIDSLSSVVVVPQESKEATEPVKALHASFPEFVRSSSGYLPAHFRFESGDIHRVFLLRCLDIMRQRLREGLLGQEINRRTHREDVSADTISNSISPGLRYAAQHWLDHLSAASWDRISSVDVIASLSQFVDERLLHWLECLAWTGMLDDIQEILDSPLIQSTLSSLNPEFGHAFRDVQQILATESDMLKEYPQEVYYNALVWLPKSICKPLNRERTTRSLPTIVYGLPETWSASEYEDKRVVLMDTLFIPSNLPVSRWLSVSTNSPKIILHEWDTKKEREIQLPLDVEINEGLISRISNTGVFSFEPKEKVLYFRSLFPHASLQYPTKVWNLDLGLENEGSESPHTELCVSLDGKYVGIWYQDQGQVYLVNVTGNSWKRLTISEVSQSEPPVRVSLCFCDDGNLLGVFYSFGAESSQCDGFQIHESSTGALHFYRNIKTRCTELWYLRFSPESKISPALVIQGQFANGPRCLQYRSDSGDLLSNQYIKYVTPRVAHFNWTYFGSGEPDGSVGIPFDQDNVASGSQNIFRTLPGGRHFLCRTPPYHKWDQQAQVGGTHLFLASSIHGMLVIKIPEHAGNIGIGAV